MRTGLLCLLVTSLSAYADDAKKSLPEKAVAVLDKADRIELYSLEPEPEKKPEKTLRGWAVLGKVTLEDAKVRNQVLTSLKEGVGRGRGAKCFDPRHAIQASRAGQTVDIVICFECGWVYVYYDGEQEPSAVLTINRAAQSEFDKILKAAGVALSPPPKQK